VDSTGISAKTTYWYKVVAKNAAGPSKDGAEAKVITALLPAPAAPTVTRTGDTATVTWAAVTGATSYVVERATDNGCGAPLAFSPVATNATGTSFSDTKAVAPTKFWYRVTATNSTGASVPSAQTSTP
jgi:hypothetical protein